MIKYVKSFTQERTCEGGKIDSCFLISGYASFVKPKMEFHKGKGYSFSDAIRLLEKWNSNFQSHGIIYCIAEGDYSK